MDCTVCCQPDENKEIVVGGNTLKEKPPGYTGEFPPGSETTPGLPAAAEYKKEETEERSANPYAAAAEAKIVEGPKKRDIQVSIKMDKELGLDVDYGDKVSLVVVKVKAGVIEDWNKKNKELEVCVDDRITKANSLGGSTDTIIKVIKESKELELTVQKFSQYTCVLEKASGNAPSGLDLNGGTVRQISSGPFKQYNLDLPNRNVDIEAINKQMQPPNEKLEKKQVAAEDIEIKPGSKILEVNGKRSPADIAKELDSSKLLKVAYQP